MGNYFDGDTFIDEFFSNKGDIVFAGVTYSYEAKKNGYR
jgi:hypothetical protein